MTFNIEVPDLPSSYGYVLSEVLRHGHWTNPRGDGTIEVLGASVLVHDTEHTLPVGTGRGVNTQLADVEALELIAGVHDPESQRFNPASGFVNDPNLECYGPLTRDGIERSIGFLRQDRNSRRAVANLAHVGLDSGYPCLASLGWVIRKNRLHAFADFRSNDAWLGMPYDVHAVAALQHSMAYVLGAEPGPLHWYARSLHVYDRHVTKAKDIDGPTTWRPTTRVTCSTWTEARCEAAARLAALKG